MHSKKDKKCIELLAPAKDLETGIAAVNYGADAVYIGAPKYSARAAAGNSIINIEKLIQYAHRYRVKVYAALNTILFDDELREAEEMIRSLYESGADALIIQDMGILELDIPPIPLFASTQVHNYSLEKIQFLEKTGFQRVILARELSLKQIKDIRRNTSIDLEFFIHGALCVNFSGRCYLSRATQGRSANRGVCAQPCRLPYALIDKQGNILAKDKYLLSLKDINLSDYLRDLIDAGVYSFKIEGRLKDENYVKNVTAFYRKRIDEIIEKDSSLIKASSGRTIISFQPDPSKTFNRGFTQYFFKNRDKNILSSLTPKSTGACLGKVEKAGRNYFILETSEMLHSGDGICFFNDKEALCGTNVNKVDGNRIYLSENKGIKEGMMIYRNYDYRFAKMLRENKTRRIISVNMQFEEIENGFKLYIKDEDGIEASVENEIEKEPAKNRTAAEETVRNQLMKMGDTIFAVKELKIVWNRPYFIPVSVCNKIRRETILRLEEERKKKYQRQSMIITPNNVPYPEKKLDSSSNVSNKMSEAFYRRHGVSDIEIAYDLKPDKRVPIMTMKHCLRYQFDLCPGRSNTDADILYLLNANNKLRLEFDCKNCLMKLFIEEKK
ncbi:MAG: U32 family peptidase [Bacteroidetes bacterium]|nr:U32 family peptidase [Bacteroidota bacterium]